MRLIQGAGYFAAFMQPDEFLRKLLVDVRPLAERRNLITVHVARVPLSVSDLAIMRKSSAGLLRHSEQQAHCMARSLTITPKIISASGNPAAGIYGSGSPFRIHDRRSWHVFVLQVNVNREQDWLTVVISEEALPH
jgi:hypothetical protein